MRIFVFKPDGIGDFILATGAIRRLAREYGEENLVLCVREVLVPLARSQFPRAEIWPLPVVLKRKVLNLFLRNFLFCLPLWFRLRGLKVEASVCLRGLRNYLETFLFYSPRARRYVSVENHLCRGKKVRATVEGAVQRFFRAELLPYPESAEDAPLEIEAHRRIVSRLLGREIPLAEVLPILQATPQKRPEPFWICAPITSASKVYPLPSWAEVFRELKPRLDAKPVLLVGSPDQRPQLEELELLLQAEGIAGAQVFIPPTLEDFLHLIGGTELMLTVDTAAAHFATALDRPTVVAFSGLHRGMFAPWQRSDRQAWLLPDPPPKKKSKWAAAIPPARIAATAAQLLDKTASGDVNA